MNKKTHRSYIDLDIRIFQKASELCFWWSHPWSY